MALREIDRLPGHADAQMTIERMDRDSTGRVMFLQTRSCLQGDQDDPQIGIFDQRPAVTPTAPPRFLIAQLCKLGLQIKHSDWISKMACGMCIFWFWHR